MSLTHADEIDQCEVSTGLGRTLRGSGPAVGLPPAPPSFEDQQKDNDYYKSYRKYRKEMLKCKIEVSRKRGDRIGTTNYAMALADAESEDCDHAGLSNQDEYRCKIEIYKKYGITDKAATWQKQLLLIEGLVKEKAEKEEATRKDAAELQQRCSHAVSGRIGMTLEEIIHSKWGNPSERHTTTTATHQ
jgi:hypothetical protein